MSRSKKNSKALRVDMLEVALNCEGATHEATAPLVATADLLRPHEPSREIQRAHIKARMLRAAQIEFSDTTSTGSGSLDDTLDCDVHNAVVDLPGGGRVLLADLDRIDSERARELARSALRFELER